jgi:phosphoserine phosphatase
VPKPIAPPKPIVPKEPPAEILARPDILKRKPPRTRRLAPGRWKSAVSDALEKVLEYTGEETPGYSVNDPPVVVFELDDVLVNGHLGQAIFYRLVRRAEFKFNDAFWEKIPEQYGRARIQAGWRGFRGAPRDSWPLDPYYRMYRKGMVRAYRQICESVSRRACNSWAASLLAGFGERELRNYSRATLIEELDKPLGFASVGDSPEDPKPERERQGMRFIPETIDLTEQLIRRGIDVWVISDTNDWAATLLAGVYGIHPSRVVGIRLKAAEQVIGGEPLTPIPHGMGSAEAVTMFINRVPVLSVASEPNEPLLEWGHGARIVVTRGPLDRRTEARWRNRGWLIQPAFSAIRAPQKLPGTRTPESDEAGPQETPGSP